MSISVQHPCVARLDLPGVPVTFEPPVVDRVRPSRGSGGQTLHGDRGGPREKWTVTVAAIWTRVEVKPQTLGRAQTHTYHGRPMFYDLDVILTNIYEQKEIYLHAGTGHAHPHVHIDLDDLLRRTKHVCVYLRCAYLEAPHLWGQSSTGGAVTFGRCRACRAVEPISEGAGEGPKTSPEPMVSVVVAPRKGMNNLRSSAAIVCHCVLLTIGFDSHPWSAIVCHQEQVKAMRPLNCVLRSVPRVCQLEWENHIVVFWVPH